MENTPRKKMSTKIEVEAAFHVSIWFLNLFAHSERKTELSEVKASR